MTHTACRSCGRPLSPAGRSPEPGKLRHFSRGLCRTCHRHHAADYDPLKTPRADVVAEVEFLSGTSPERVAESLAMTVGAVARALYRAGRADLAAPFERIRWRQRWAAGRAA